MTLGVYVNISCHSHCVAVYVRVLEIAVENQATFSLPQDFQLSLGVYLDQWWEGASNPLLTPQKVGYWMC